MTSFGLFSKFRVDVIGSCVSKVISDFVDGAVKTFDYSAQLRTPSPRQAAQ